MFSYYNFRKAQTTKSSSWFALIFLDTFCSFLPFIFSSKNPLAGVECNYLRGRLIGRTWAFEAQYLGSSPSPAAARKCQTLWSFRIFSASQKAFCEVH